MDTFICICCRRRLKSGEAHMTTGVLGICARCFEKLKRIAVEDPFCGTKSVGMLLSPFYYQDPLRSAILRYKFMNQRAYSRVFTELMADFVRKFPELQTYDGIVSVPLSRKRILERGYNQADLICMPLARRLKIRHIPNGVFRKKNTMPQSSLRARERYENVRDAFIANKERIAGKRIILFDDIFTMGATMESCASELVDQGAKEVLGMSLAIARKGE